MAGGWKTARSRLSLHTSMRNWVRSTSVHVKLWAWWDTAATRGLQAGERSVGLKACWPVTPAKPWALSPARDPLSKVKVDYILISKKAFSKSMWILIEDDTWCWPQVCKVICTHPYAHVHSDIHIQAIMYSCIHCMHNKENYWVQIYFYLII